MTSSSSLQKELKIPQSATLEVIYSNNNIDPSSSPFSSSSSSSLCPSLIAISSSNSSIPIHPTTSVHTSNNSNSNNESKVIPKFIIVGRQANVADIRINHKSISRKHAALYYRPKDIGANNNNNNDNNNNHYQLILQDLGGKFGCYVNGVKVDGHNSIVLNHGDMLIFGNVREQSFKVDCKDDIISIIGHMNNNIEKKELIEAKNDEHQNNTLNTNQSSSEKPMLTGRAAREAEIAAMMESFNQVPTYTKYNPTTEIKDKEPNTFDNHDNRMKISESLKTNDKLHKIPIAKSITISNTTTSSNSSLATTLSLDPSGSRLLVGMSNGIISLYDFNGMDLSLQPFRSVSIQEGRYSIVSTTFSNSGDRIMLGSTSATPLILDRDGYEIVEFAKGDMYVTDMAHTDGHVANITGVDWHPFDRDIVVTASLDGSIRQWNLDKGKTKFEKLCCGKNVYRIKSSMGKKTKVTCVKYSPTGREFACGTSCGSIQIWNSTKIGSRPDRVIYDAHGKDIAVHSLVFSNDAKKLASRCMEDDSVKIWDVRRLSRTSKPIAVCPGLLSIYEYSNTSFSPDGNLLCVGTSVEPHTKQENNTGRQEYGQLKIYDISKDAEFLVSIRISPNISAITCTWHKKLNQIIVGLSDGSVRIYYDPDISAKGALLPVSKGLKQEDGLSLLLKSRAPTGSAGINLADIQTPHALPMYRDAERNTKRKREKERQDPIKSKRPDLPGTGIKAGEGTAAGLNFQQYNLTSAIYKNKNIAGKDPREELFKYQEGKSYTKVSYDGDVKVLAEKTAEQEEEEEEGS